MDWFVSYDLRFCSFGYVYTVFSDPVNSHRSWICHNMNSNGTELEHYESFTHRTLCYRAFSFTWPAPMQIYWNKRKRLHKKRVQLPQDWFGTPTWLPFHCFGTPTWPPWRHVKTLYCSRKGFGALSSSPHSWMFTSVSVGSNPRPYLFATATVRMGVYTAPKYITKAIQHLSHWSLSCFLHKTCIRSSDTSLLVIIWSLCLITFGWSSSDKGFL